MGNATLWYYPEGRRVVRKIDLGGALSDLMERPEPLSVVEEAHSGRRTTTILRQRFRVRLVLERFSSNATERDVRAVIHHLQRGGLITVAGDASKAWCGYGAPPTGTSIVTRGNPWYSDADSATLASGDEVYIQTPYPDCRAELVTTTGIVQPYTVVLSTATRDDLASTATLCCVRHRDFWPALRLHPESQRQEQLNSFRRIGWTWDVDLVEDLDVLFAPAGMGPGALASSTAASAAGRYTLGERMRQIDDTDSGIAAPSRSILDRL